ncbi:sensor domain-containing protein [Ammonicoccus fulvus]|uniref:Sensor domain-containing protein n=1 Tax=Ammonicoccus fulvus TaxID=3138240 RepID=A0ABZ3FMC1_9ACTN
MTRRLQGMELMQMNPESRPTDSIATETATTPSAYAVSDATPRRPLSDLPVAFPAMLSGFRFAGYALAELCSVLWFSLVLCLSVVGVGLPLLSRSSELLRDNAERQRRAAYVHSGIPVLAHYRSVPEGRGWLGLGTFGRKYTDPMTWRDLVWHIVNPAIGLTIGVLPAGLTLLGVWGLVLVLGPEALRDAVITRAAAGMASFPSTASAASRWSGSRQSSGWWPDPCWPGRCCASMGSGLTWFWAATRRPGSGNASKASNRPGPRPWTSSRPRSSGSSGICTMGRRRGWSPWA